MTRTRPDNRLTELARAAADVFIESGGYKRTQIEDIAKRAGISKGTVYLYVESKEALFDLALRLADSPDNFPIPDELPIASPQPGATLEYVSQRLTTDESFLNFAERTQAQECPDPEEEVEGFVRALYQAMYRNCHAIKLVDSCAVDHPELAEMWYGAARGGVAALLTPFLEKRIAENQYIRVPDIPLASRFILEACMVWGIHIHWDPNPETLNHAEIESTLVHFITRGLLRIQE